MAKPQQPDNKTAKLEVPGEGVERVGMEEVEAEERGGKQGVEAADPPPRRRREQTNERHKDAGSGAETEAEEEVGNEDEEDGEGKTPRGAPLEFIRVGGNVPPWRKTWTNQTLSQTVCTCCCRNRTETFHTTTMGCTWMGELRTMPSGSIVGAG